MAILQISKIQQRSGNLVDLPQLDDAEFGWATDAKRLFIGKTTPNENIEILTSYSQINFSQINGTVGNLNISNVTIADGQLLVYDSSEWVNRGGDAGGLITLGDASNVKITGGSIGYVLETDGLGNLSWTPKSTILSYIENVTKADPAVVTTTQDNFFTQGAAITITDIPGMVQLNGNVFYVDVLTANTFALYHDSGLANTVDSTGYTAFSYSTVSATSTLTDEITVANSAVFSLNDPIVFAGDLGNSTIVVGDTYYIKTKPSGTTITISETAGGTTFDPGTEASPTNARVYVPGGRALSVVSGGTTSLAAAGTDTQIQYNDTNLLQGNADFTYNNSTKLLNLNGNANVGNLNATGVVSATQYISNIATGTAPLTVTSTTRVSNLNVSYSNVSDFGVVTSQTTGTYYPVLVNSSATGNRALAANANISINVATGNLSVPLLSVTSNANVGNLGVSGLVGVAGNVTASRLISNVANGTAPIAVSSSTRVANLNVSYANVSDFAVVTTQSTGTYYPVFVSGSSTANYALAANSGISANLANGSITATTLVGNLTGNVTGNVSGNISGTIVAPGANTQVIFNDAGNVNATSGLTFNKSTNTLTVSNAVSVTGNISGANLTGNHYGNGSALSSITGANVTGTVANATYAVSAGSAGTATTAGTVTTNAQPNITSVGTLSALTVFGNISGGNVSGIIRPTAGSGTAGIIFPADPGGGSGDLATIKYYASAGESTILELAVTNDPDDKIYLNATGGTQIANTLTTTSISTGANTTAGSITGNWTLTSGSKLQATYADLAEYYEADETYEPGTVLMFGGEKEVTVAEDSTNRVAGVVSTNPAYLMNNDCPGNKVAIALQGRVPCKVRGKISKGDMLVSGGSGFARPNQFPSIGTVIGKALEDFDGYEGVIEVAVGRL